MAEFFDSRRLRYEILMLCDKRWQIAEVVDDGRESRPKTYGRSDFEALEKSVLAKATALLTGEVKAVRVMRERTRDDGFTTTTQLLFREATGGKSEAPVTVSRYDGAVDLCASAGDLYGRPACKVIGVLLRAYLDKHFITPLELLHFHSYIRKLNDSYSLVQGALHQVVAAQVKAAGGDVKARGQQLLGFLDAVERQARDALAEKRMPTIEGGDFRRFYERMAARYEGEGLRFNVMVGIARHFQGAQSFLPKLEFALALVPGDLPAEMRSQLDEFAAGCLDSSQLVMDLLGHQPNLAAALVSLALLARGEEIPTQPGSPLAALREAIGRGQLPYTAAALWDRVERELARGRPLARADNKQEWNTLIKTSDRLEAICPEERKHAIAGHFKDRLRRLRESAAMRD